MGKWWSIWGLVASAVGVLLLFFFGMPFRVRTGGKQHFLLAQTDTAAQRMDKIYTVIGYVGLLLLLAGTAMQVIGAYESP